jgi:hypothetical protein
MPSPANHISLKGFFCLKVLTLLVDPFYVPDGVTGFADWGRNFHIANLLKDTPLTQTLKDLSIGLISSRPNLTDSDWHNIYDSKVWKDLDLVLHSFSTLQRMVIQLKFTRYETIPVEFWAGMRGSMLFAEERGILNFKSNLDPIPEREISTYINTMYAPR